jgi:hypothetical protein
VRGGASHQRWHQRGAGARASDKRKKGAGWSFSLEVALAQCQSSVSSEDKGSPSRFLG